MASMYIGCDPGHWNGAENEYCCTQRRDGIPWNETVHWTIFHGTALSAKDLEVTLQASLRAKRIRRKMTGWSPNVGEGATTQTRTLATPNLGRAGLLFDLSHTAEEALHTYHAHFDATQTPIRLECTVALRLLDARGNQLRWLSVTCATTRRGGRAFSRPPTASTFAPANRKPSDPQTRLPNPPPPGLPGRPAAPATVAISLEPGGPGPGHAGSGL